MNHTDSKTLICANNIQTGKSSTGYLRQDRMLALLTEYNAVLTQTASAVFTVICAMLPGGVCIKLYKYTNGKCNISGSIIRDLREHADLSQEQLAARLQLAGLSLNQKAVSRIETGDRVVPDFELIYFSEVLDVPVCRLLNKESCTH